MIELLDALALLRRFRSYLSGAGGIGDMMAALKWSIWYALVWYEAIKLLNKTDLPLVRALRLSLTYHGYLDGSGEVKKRIEKPPIPKGREAHEWLKLHEAFDEMVMKVAEGNVGRDALRNLFDFMQSQNWYKLWRDGFLAAAGFERARRVIEPKMRGGRDALEIYKKYKPELYAGYEDGKSDEAVKVLLEAAPVVEVGRCSGAGICVFQTPSACSIVEELNVLTADAVLLFNIMHWFVDPLRELACLRKAAPLARFYVGQPVVETMPGFLAINTAMGAFHVFSRNDVEALLRSAGLRREALLLRSIPFYAAIWSPS